MIRREVLVRIFMIFISLMVVALGFICFYSLLTIENNHIDAINEMINIISY